MYLNNNNYNGTENNHILNVRHLCAEPPTKQRNCTRDKYGFLRGKQNTFWLSCAHMHGSTQMYLALLLILNWQEILN